MLNKILKHPALHHTQEISNICRPLNQLNISYFAHVRIDNDEKFSAVCSNPNFLEHYLKNQYYNADIHMSGTHKFGSHVIWDAIEYSGQTAKMLKEATEMGHQHIFTIINKNSQGNDFYHFATRPSSSTAINQVYISNIDLLNLFILHFNEQISQSKILSSVYDLTFGIDLQAEGSAAKIDTDLVNLDSKRLEFVRQIGIGKYASNNTAKLLSLDNPTFIIHKDTHEPLFLSPQQIKCLSLISYGKSIKETAQAMNLSPRTVEHYLNRVRKILGCRNNKELVSGYYSQIKP